MSRSFIKLGEGLYFELSKAKDLTKLIKKQVIDKNGVLKTVNENASHKSMQNIADDYSEYIRYEYESY